MRKFDSKVFLLVIVSLVLSFLAIIFGKQTLAQKTLQSSFFLSCVGLVLYLWNLRNVKK